MIKRLRKKFILITMASIFIVLALVIGCINIFNYHNVIDSSDHFIDMILDDKVDRPIKPDKGDRPNDSPEMPFSIRYFTVTYEDNIITAELKSIASVSDTDAKMYADTVKNRSSRGFYNDFRYRVIATEGNTKVIFVDCNREMSGFNSFLLISISISLVSYFVLFLLIFFLSKLVVRPFYINQEKQKRFITDASHELKTPLTVINANTEIIEMVNGENEWTLSIKKQVERLSNMTKKLSLMARLDEIDDSVALTSVNISEVLDGSIESFKTISIINNLTINEDIEGDVIINSNMDLLKDLFSILFENAIKYSKSLIDISLKKNNKNVIITLKNNANVPDGNLDYLFERFYRLDESRSSKTGGSGIGLSLAKAIVENLGGSISACGLNNYITFTIIFKI